MPGDIGLVAKVLDTLASWFLSEEGYGEFAKRRVLRRKKEECRQALIDGDWDRLRRLVDELQRLANAP